VDTFAWSAQQLARYLAAVSSFGDETAAVRGAIELAAEAFEAEAGAVLEGEVVRGSVGFPSGRIPLPAIGEALARREPLEVPGAGPCHVLAVPVPGDEGVMMLARTDPPFDREEGSLLRSMATVLSLTLGNQRTMTSLRERQVLLERMSSIQRAISLRSPLQEVFDAVTSGTAEQLRDPIVGLYLIDPADPDWLLCRSVRGDSVASLLRGSRLRVGRGVTGRAFSEDRLVVVEGYAGHPDADRRAERAGLQATMAAPVRDGSRVVGCLVVGSLHQDRAYGLAEREVLQAFAELASLAVADAGMVDALRRAVGDATHRATHDPLTGLANRTRFLDRLGHTLAQRRPAGSTPAVLYVDIDDFKAINDRFGHAVGDLVLAETARRLSDSVRAGDTVARLGGDEFAVLLEQATGLTETTAAAERILLALRAPLRLGGVEVYCNASVGVAVQGDNDWSADELLRNADVAMYRAKNSGKDCTVVFESAMYEALLDRLDLETDLRQLVHADAVEVFFQPIVRLSDQEVLGVEALARWAHPRRGYVPPETFIPLAEATGLISALGRQILVRACEWAGAWRKAKPASNLYVSVNLSAAQLQDPELPELVQETLRSCSLPPGSLVLEITESVLMQDTALTSSRLRQLKDLGVRLALDDFGTGYSSLSYLRRFPVDVLKIDRSFVSSLRVGDDLRRLTEAIIALGAALGLECLAEGIEHVEELDLLRHLGCELGQGSYFAWPMPAALLEGYMRNTVLPSSVAP
jgi:diguanylate cyclase (GGDEF)-like protein